MATRTISTKLAIDGEGEYRAALSRVNTELKTLQSSLKLTESQYQTNANSMEALKAKGDALTGLYEAQKTKVDTLRAALENAKTAHDNFAQKSEELKAKIQANNEALEKLRATTGDTTAEEQKLIKENEALNAELAKNEQYAAAAEKGVNSWQTQLNKAQIDLNNLDAELKQNDALLDEAKNSADGCAHSIDKFGNETRETGDAVEALAQALAAAGLAKAANEIADALRESVDAAIEFESAMAGVKRTVGGGDDFITTLGNRFKELSTQIPISTGELAKIAETAGQLGIKRENVEQFTTVMAKLSTTTDLTADSAATMLAQFANITGVSDYERLGAVVADLGDSTATTASKVVEMAQGMAASASVAGMSERDILAISAAVGSLGIESQAGSTAMSTLISTIYSATETGDKLEDFASVAGMSAGEFKESWSEDAVGTLNAFITGLNDTERNGRSAIVVLDDLGIKNVRQTKAILGLSEAGDLLTRTIGQANKAWEENTALDEKASIMYETTEAKITKYRNSVDNLKVAIGDQLTPALGNLAEAGTSITSWAEKMVRENEWLAPTITVVTTSVIGFTGALSASIAVIKAVELAQKALNTSLLSNPFTLAATAAATLIGALVTLAATLPSAKSEYDVLSATSKDQYDTLQRLNAEYDRACDLYGENSEEAQRLASQLAAESALFERNKTTANQFVQELDDLISKNERLGQTGQEARDAIEAQRESSQYLVEKLQSLQEEENQSIGVKQQIIDVVQELNQEIPDLGLAYDNYSGKLNMTAESIKKVIEKELERRELEANIDDLLGREKAQRENAEAMAALLEEQAAAKERLAEATEAMNAALTDDDGDDSRAALTRMTEYISAVNEAQSYVDELAGREQTLTEKMAANGSEIERLNGLITGYQEETSAAYSAEEQAVKQVSDSLTALAKAYRDAYDAAHDSLDSQIGLWTKMDNEASKSVGNLQEAVNSQVTYLERYSENLSSLLDRNIEGIERFAQNFTDGSAESAAALAGLSTASDEEIRNLMESMSQVDGYKDSLSSLFAALETNLTGSLASIKDQYASAITEISNKGGDIDFSPFVTAVQEQFSAVGAQIIQKAEETGKNIDVGLQNGLVLDSGKVYIAANAMAQGVVDSLLTVFDSHSPSRKAEKIGKDVDAGLAQGISGQAEPVMSAANSLGEELTEQMRTAGQESVEGFNEEYRVLIDRVQETLEETRSTINGFSWPIAGEAQSLGTQMVDGMISGIYGHSGFLYSAMAEVTQEAIEAARQAADTHSPSKKTEKIFEDVGEGMVVGIEAKKQKVRTATADVVNSALIISPDAIREFSRSINSSIPDLGSLIGVIREHNYGNSPFGNSLSQGRSTNYNIENVEMHITTQPGQNNEEIAEYVMNKMQRELERKGGAF